MKRFNVRLFKGAIVAAIAVVVAAVVFVVLAATKVIDGNPLQLGFSILCFGTGAIFALYGAIVKGGYETAVGMLLLIVGTVVVLIGVLLWWVIVIIAAGMMLVALLLLFLMKGSVVVPERADEKEGYRPYSEVLAEKKAKQKEEEEKPLPEIKDYSDKK